VDLGVAQRRLCRQIISGKFRAKERFCEEADFGCFLGRSCGQIRPLPFLHRQSLDLRSFGQHLVVSSEVNIGGCHIVKRFVIALVVVVRDEVAKRSFQLPRELDSSDPQRLVMYLGDLGRAATLELSKMRVVCMPSTVPTRFAS
jgi:hypothetical protein